MAGSSINQDLAFLGEAPDEFLMGLLLLEHYLQEHPAPPTLDQLHAIGPHFFPSKQSLREGLSWAIAKGLVMAGGGILGEGDTATTFMLTEGGRHAATAAWAIGKRRLEVWDTLLSHAGKVLRKSLRQGSKTSR